MEVFVLTERKKGIVKTVFGWLFLALAFASFILTLMGALLLFLPGVLFAVIWYCFFLKANKEFECSYFDGELRFARITNKSRRKRIGVYNIEEVVTIAPAGDRSQKIPPAAKSRAAASPPLPGPFPRQCPEGL